MRARTIRLAAALAAIGLCLLAAAPAGAIVLHPGDDPDDPGYTPLTDKPPDNVVGAWDPHNASYGKASCVVAGPNHVLTTQHQGYVSGTTVDLYVGGVLTTFQVAEASKHLMADVMIGKLKTLAGQPANLLSYTPAYAKTDETSSGVNPTVIGGWGMRRGATLSSGGQDYGYAWTGTELATLTWGRNDQDGTDSDFTVDAGWKTFTSDVLEAHFDEPGVDYEAGIAGGDSGGGAFINDGGVWKVAGISAYTKHGANQETWFDDPNAPPPQPSPDLLWSIRVSSYETWISGIVSDFEIPPGDANWDGVVDLTDFRRVKNYWDPLGSGHTWEQGDFDADGAVGNTDFAIVLANWTAACAPPDMEGSPALGPVPEPATPGLLAVGLAGLSVRRRRRGAR